MRYVLGPGFGPVSITVPPVVPPPPPAHATDLVPTLGTVDDSGVQLVFPAYDPSQVNVPVEARVYLAPSGSTLPGDVAGWLASSLPLLIQMVAPAAAGETVKVPMPTVAPGDYLGQVLLGYTA